MTARTGTATVLFTDLVGSTALRAALGEERTDDLRRDHDALLAACVQEHGGTVVKGGGDGILATFDSAAGGVAAAVAIQQAVSVYNRSRRRVTELSLRVGLSTGDVTWEGGDCFGLPVVEAARLEAAAEGGQILCSELVRLMSRGRGGHEFRAIGFLELKGLPDPLAACEIAWSEPDALHDEARPFPLPPELSVAAGARFVSRTTELEEAVALVSDPSRTRAGVIWLLGEPGIGKTRLAAEIAGRCYASGANVLFGRCNEDLAVPYQPFLEALRWTVAHLGDDAPAARLGAQVGELTRLLPELHQRFPRLVTQPSTSPEIEQYRLFEAIRLWLATQSAEAPLVFVLDDAHWATAETVQLLGHIARSAEPSGVVMICTARSTAPDRSPALADLATDLLRAATPSHLVTLEGLAEAEVAELVFAAAGAQLAESAGRLFRETAGNPLFLTTLLAAFSVGTLALPDTLPSSVQDAVRRRLRTIPAGVVELLRLAALIGLDFDVAVLALAADVEEDGVIDQLEVAAAAGLVVETGYNRHRFAHALVREALRSELSETRRVRSHARIALALQRCGPDQLDALAHHFWEARDGGHREAAHDSAIAAARRADALLSYQEAAHHYARAAELAAPATRPELLLAQGLAQHHGGDMLVGLATMYGAGIEAERVGLTSLIVEAALAVEQGSWQPAAFTEEALDLLQRARRVLGDGSARSIRLDASLARALGFLGRADEAHEIGVRALAAAREQGGLDLIGYVLVRLALLPTRWFDQGGLSSLVAELAEVVRTSADDELAIQALNVRLLLLTRLGRIEDIRRENPSYAARAEPLRQPFWSIGSLFYELGLAFAAADLDGAEQTIEKIAETNRSLQVGDLSGADGLRLFQLRREQGRLAEIEPALHLLLRLRTVDSLWQPGLVATFAALGWHEEARVRLDALDLGRLPDDNLRELALCLLTDAVDAIGGHQLVAELYAALLPGTGLCGFFGHGVLSPGPIDRYLGVLAALDGDEPRADAHFAAALALAREMPAPLYVGHTAADWGRWLRRWGRDEQSTVLLDEARTIAERHGLGGLHQRVGSRP